MSFDAKSTFSNYRIPPDNTSGKRLGTTLYHELAYTGLTGSALVVGQYLVGQTSQAEAEIIEVFPSSPTAGTVYIVSEGLTPSVFTLGEILLRENVQVATAGAQIDHHIPLVQLSSRDSPFHSQKVDRKGAAIVRYTEGEQQLDAYGLTRIAQPQIIGAYDFQYDAEPEDFYATVTGVGATQSYDSNQHAVVLDVGTAAGERAAYTSNAYWSVWPGSGQIINIAFAAGDTGKQGVVRRWGYYSSRDGVFFELSGTNLYTVIRSSVSGAPIDTKVSQSLWNVDSISEQASDDGMVIDVSKLNVYWFNLQTLTAGRVRFGVLNDDGNRIDVHNAVNLNEESTPQMNRVSLPLRVEVFNEDASISPSRASFFGAMVKTESPWDVDEVPISRYSSFTAPKVEWTGSDQYPVVTFRSDTLFKGVENGLITVPRLYSAYVSGSVPLIMRVVKNAVLNTSSWIPAGSNTPVVASIVATSMSDGREVYTQMLDVGVNNDSFDSWIWDYRAERMTARDGEYGDTFTISFQKVEEDGAASGVVFGATWSDIG